jgi:acetyl-CoA C-acetyltransferase
MSGGPPGVIGTGQTKYKKARSDVSMPGLLREAAQRALDDAGLDWPDIDAVVFGKAPDLFEGVMQPELFMADALGAAGKPMLRVHTAGSVGCSTAVVATDMVRAGRYPRVLAVAWEKQSEGNAQWGLGGGRSNSMGAGGIFAPWMRSYIQRSGAPEHIGWKVSVKDHLNACKNPYAHLHLKDITIEQVRDSPMLWDPIHFLESCPSSDGACAVVLATNEIAQKHKDVAWVLSTAMRSELGQFPGRDPVRPQAGVECAQAVYEGAGITNPRQQIDVAELYVPFSWYEPMWLEGHDIAGPGEGWRMTDDGSTEMTGDFPVNPSGGVLSSNPIGASGMIRFAEAALQVQGKAGEHQIEGAKVSLGHAYGASAQYFAMAVLSSSPEPVG